MKILYYPDNNGVNEYSNRFKSILNKVGSVEGTSSRKIVKDIINFRVRTHDYIFVNWLESGLINKNGRFSFRGFAKCCLKLLLFKMTAKNTIYVRHNVYPHAVIDKDVKKAKYYTDLLESLCDKSFVHSPTITGERRVYIPHPLYQSVIIKKDFINNKPSRSYVFFGRITRYKKLDELIKHIPSDVQLTIAGSCDDEEYLHYLKELAPDNVHVKGGFISDPDAHALIESSQGLIIAHADSDMIVSGSFFYALSIGVRVLCVESEFLRWAERVLGNDILVCYKSIVDLGSDLSALPQRKSFDENLQVLINEQFGDEAILTAINDKIITQV
ncbi:hypothetical protein JEM67_08650 [Serratia sp. PAMC26656]|uniref:hypothetical protein n=1 Tax=Serratia sp. PAMC26656 TaxID=2775909 RepID=UPI0018F7271A|nr:hypothetical protein [Serratia sp. PAMC26656]MBJ7889790.1 hypothetical protein [Serratia sp. PAMC26656]